MKRKTKQSMATFVLISALIGFLSYRFAMQSAYSSLRSFDISLLEEVQRQPGVLAGVTARQGDAWQEISEEETSGIISFLLEKGKLDVGRALEWRLRRKVAQRNLKSILIIQVFDEQGGNRKLRIIDPGPDQRFHTEDDEILNQ